LGEYLAVSEKLYEAMWRASGKQTLIDSSKVPSYGIALKQMHGVKVYMLHLVRDPRGAAYSWSRQKYQPDGTASFVRKQSAQSSLIWMAWNAAIEAFKSKTDGYLRIRYEDFVVDPAAEIQRILAMLGRTASSLPMVAQQEVFLRAQHTIGGNPDRFRTGRVEIQPDDAWKREMAASSKFAVTALTGPLLVKYGYPLTT
jgi:hypothetical protein